MAVPSVLALKPAVVRRSVQDGSVTRYPESHYLDFEIDGSPLREFFPISKGLLTPLNRPWLAAVPDAVEQLLGRAATADLSGGRIPLLVCAECGDLGCGALTAALRVEGRFVTWSDFRWENGFELGTAAGNGAEAITFAREDYVAVLADASERVSLLPYDELAHAGRKFLWPWQWGWRLPPN